MGDVGIFYRNVHFRSVRPFSFLTFFFSFLSSKHTAGLCRRKKLVMLVLVWD